ncbi:hypothetical protein ACQRAR_07900 [Anaerovoracaceae bacterium SGI.174]
MRKKDSGLKRAAKGLAKTDLLVLFLLCLMLVGVTAGFLISTDSVTNRLSCGYNTAEIVENYVPLSSFAKGEEVTKEVKVRNEGSVPCYVRVFAEISRPEAREAIDVDFSTSDWSKMSDGYYYYSRVLNAGEESSSLFTTLTAKENVSDFEMICYSESVQAYGFAGAKEAFEAIR